MPISPVRAEVVAVVVLAAAGLGSQALASSQQEPEMVPLVIFGPPASVGRIHISPAGEPYRNRGNVLETATGIWCNGHACIRQFPRGTVVTLKGEAKTKKPPQRPVFDTNLRNCNGLSVCKVRMTQLVSMKSWFCRKSLTRAQCIRTLPGNNGKG
jgi:hypothetical protein